MNLPPWVADAFTLSLTLSHWRQLGLAFLLGSFAVATWSDLKRLSAQREFLEIWVAFLVCVLAFDLYETTVQNRLAWQVVAIKWGLIALFSFLCVQVPGVPLRLLRLAPGDVAALAAAASLLTPVCIVIFYVGAKLLALVCERWLWRGRLRYPFMPVVSATTLLVLALGLFLGTPAPVPVPDHGVRPSLPAQPILCQNSFGKPMSDRGVR